jgi:hypothetical protein
MWRLSIPLSEQAAKFYEMVKERVGEMGFSLEFDCGAKLLD